VWTQIVLKTEQNSSVFVRKRISVDGALVDSMAKSSSYDQLLHQFQLP